MSCIGLFFSWNHNKFCAVSSPVGSAGLARGLWPLVQTPVLPLWGTNLPGSPLGQIYSPAFLAFLLCCTLCWRNNRALYYEISFHYLSNQPHPGMTLLFSVLSLPSQDLINSLCTNAPVSRVLCNIGVQFFKYLGGFGIRNWIARFPDMFGKNTSAWFICLFVCLLNIC